MNSLQVRGDWNLTKGKLKQKWADLTVDDLRYVDGKKEALVGRRQKRTGATRESIQTIIQGFPPGDHEEITGLKLAFQFELTP